MSLVSRITDLAPLNFDENATSRKTPVYILLPQIKSEIETRLIARIKKARLFYRSFDPEEHGRLSALEASENVAVSHGVVIPLLPNHFTNAEVHNFRAAFLAGLTLDMATKMACCSANLRLCGKQMNINRQSPSTREGDNEIFTFPEICKSKGLDANPFLHK